MSSQPPTRPSPAEIADLEHAFATDPSGQAYHPLAEAYLSMDRYMEAMVVCKKGARALPKSAEPRLLLARIQLAQNRQERALTEIDAALALEPTHLLALRMAAEIRLERGEKEEGAALLERAAEVDPGDLAVSELARAHGLSLQSGGEAEAQEAPAQADAPEEPPAAAKAQAPAEAPAKAEAPTQAEAPKTTKAQAQAETSAEAAPTAQAAAPKKASKKASKQAAAPKDAPQKAQAPAAGQTPIARQRIDLSSWEDDDDLDTAPRSSKKDVRRLGLTAAAMVLLLGGWFGYTSYQGAKEREIADLLQQTAELVRKDTYKGYAQATETAERIVDLDKGHLEGQAYLAYISALRWGEQGEGEEFHRRAKAHLDAAKALGASHHRVVAADALVHFFEGEPSAAQATLEEAIADGRRSGLGLLLETLGTIRMESGELDAAAKALKDAQGYDFNSVRLLSALGRVHWRQGLEQEAWAFFDSALRLDGEHAESLLGKALLILDSEAERDEADRVRLLEEASAQIEKVLALPSGETSTRQLAKAKFAQGQLHFAKEEEAQGERLEREAFALDPTSSDIRLLRGRRLLREGKGPQAVRDFEEAIRIEPRLASYADLSEALRDQPQALVAAMKEATEAFGSSGRAWLLLGDAHHVAEQPDEARRAYERALSVEGGELPDARVRMAALHREKKEWDQAKREVERAIAGLGRGRVGASAAAAHTEMGRILEGEQDAVAAFGSYAQAISAWEAYGPAYFYLGRISAGQRSREQRTQAAESLETYLRLDPRGEHVAEARRLLRTLR